MERSPEKAARRRSRLRLLLVAVLVLGWCLELSANERLFTYTYETATLPEGARELEIWTTARVGRDGYYSRMENRLEFEWGVTDNLQSALYFNTKGILQGSGSDLEKKTYYPSVSWEWKYRLLNRSTSPVGIALYGELGYAPHEAEVELKLLADKRIGKVLVAVNFVFEREYKYVNSDVSKTEDILELDLGISYSVSPKLALGFEGRVHGAHECAESNCFEDIERYAVYAGPVVSWSTRAAWVALTFTKQLMASGGEGLDLDEHERYNARLLTGFHF